MIKLKLKRYLTTEENTIGKLFIDGVEECYTLEDLPHSPKIYGKTRIPAGTYKVTFRTEGTTHKKYLKRFPEFHKGMLWVRNVPEFEYILIHIGNSASDTDGCILVGLSPSKDFKRLVGSTIAYTNLYKKIMNAVDIEIMIED